MANLEINIFVVDEIKINNKNLYIYDKIKNNFNVCICVFSYYSMALLSYIRRYTNSPPKIVNLTLSITLLFLFFNHFNIYFKTNLFLIFIKNTKGNLCGI